MTRFVLGALLLILTAAPVSAQAISLMFDAYPGASTSDMQTRYRFAVEIDTAAPTVLAQSCAGSSCTLQLPPFAPGSTHTIRLRAACVSSPTAFGAATPPITFTVGSTVPPPLVSSPPANPCAPQPLPPLQPPASGAVTCAGSTWTLDRAVVMRNGQPTIGIADALLCVTGTLYAVRDGLYYAWLGGGFSSALPDPRGAGTPPPPTPPPPAPTSYTCTIESAPTRYALTSAQKKAGQTVADVKYTAVRCSPDTPFGKGARIVVMVAK